MFQTRSGNAKLHFRANRNMTLERNILFASREPRTNWKNRLLAPALVLGSMLVIGSIFTYSYKQKRDTIADIQDTIRNKEGKEVKAEEKKGFCAVRCKDSGPFNLNGTVFVVDLSTETTYRKEFYTKRGNLYVEGVGNDRERWFRNPGWRGDVHVVKASKLGREWFADKEYTGEEAEQRWAEAKTRFSQQ